MVGRGRNLARHGAVAAREAPISVQTYYTYVGPALVLVAGLVILAVGWVFTRPWSRKP